MDILLFLLCSGIFTAVVFSMSSHYKSKYGAVEDATNERIEKLTKRLHDKEEELKTIIRAKGREIFALKEKISTLENLNNESLELTKKYTDLCNTQEELLAELDKITQDGLNQLELREKEYETQFALHNSNKEKEINSLRKEYENRLSEQEDEINVLTDRVEQLQPFNYIELDSELKELTDKVMLTATTVNFDDGITSEQDKNALSLLKLKQDQLVKDNLAVTINSQLNRKATINNIKQLIRCFNSETSLLLSSINATNIDVVRGKIIKSFDILNKIFVTDEICLSQDFLETKLEQAILINSYQKKCAYEREEQRAIKEQMLEEEKVRREIEREKTKIEKEESQFKNEISKLMQYMQKASDIEKQLYVDKIRELETKLSLVEKDKENVLQREQNTRAGFVYIISNIGSFGENIYKIGMTRRLEPMDRIKELGDASVPFEFDVHAMIFSDDAPALENLLHQTFRNNEVNKVNHRKEFFNVSLNDIQKTVLENHNATVTFTELAKAEQYRESLRMQIS